MQEASIRLGDAFMDKLYLVSAYKGISNIPARYQFLINKNAYELVLVFCDTDLSPYTRVGKFRATMLSLW